MRSATRGGARLAPGWGTPEVSPPRRGGEGRESWKELLAPPDVFAPTPQGGLKLKGIWRLERSILALLPRPKGEEKVESRPGALSIRDERRELRNVGGLVDTRSETSKSLLLTGGAYLSLSFSLNRFEHPEDEPSYRGDFIFLAKMESLLHLRGDPDRRALGPNLPPVAGDLKVSYSFINHREISGRRREGAPMGKPFFKADSPSVLILSDLFLPAKASHPRRGPLCPLSSR